MQTVNVNPQLTVTCRHMDVTDAIRSYARKKIDSLHLDYPRIIEAKVILDVQNFRNIAEIILFCANHITIEATTEHEDMYAAIDETIDKIARRMRKRKTRLLKNSRPRNTSIRHITEQIYQADALGPDEEHEQAIQQIAEDGVGLPDLEPHRIHDEHYQVRPLYREEALMEMELTDKTFLVFANALTGRLSIIYRRKDGDYGLIEPEI